MEQWQSFRAITLRPLFACLARWRVTPDGVTFLSLLFGLAFCPLIFVSYPLAFACLFVHAVLDGLDGPLARYLGTASRRGSFTDTMVDQLVVSATTAALMRLGTIGLEAGDLLLAGHFGVGPVAMCGSPGTQDDHRLCSHPKPFVKPYFQWWSR